MSETDKASISADRRRALMRGGAAVALALVLMVLVLIQDQAPPPPRALVQAPGATPSAVPVPAPAQDALPVQDATPAVIVEAPAPAPVQTMDLAPPAPVQMVDAQASQVVSADTRPAPAVLPDGYMVQLGVFGAMQNAEALQADVSRRGLPVRIEGRVVVGPFASKQEAEAAQARLKRDGVASGIVIPPRKTK